MICSSVNLDFLIRPSLLSMGRTLIISGGVSGGHVKRQLAGGQTIAVNAAYVQENTNLAASLFLGDAARRRGELDSFTADASWRKGPYGLTLGGFKTTGSADAGIYAPEPGAGSRTGRPSSHESCVQNVPASCQLTESTGRVEPGLGLGLPPVTSW